ncbi:MAG: carbon-nitrogen hydrolase family protein [Methanosphaera sp.]|nr:carbon-nitrogen hydrolase family protein [Methanosphaera sp.]
MNNFKIATCQMNVVDGKIDNIMHSVELIREASHNGADLVCLPEMFNTPYDNNKFIENAEEEKNSITLEYMKTLAREEKIYLQAGSITEKDKDNLYNTAYLISPEGNVIGKHRKMHMFDIDTDDVTFNESDTLTAGDNITTVKTSLGRIGIAICYDIRFSELWTLMCEECDMVLLPGAFNNTTGPLHWQTLIRARAIDNQVYVVATSPSSLDNPYYVAWGHSMIVDPWGKIVTQAGRNEQILYANLCNDKIESVKKQIPVLKNKRKDIYETISK